MMKIETLQQIVREFRRLKFYTKLVNLKEMDAFLDLHNQPKLNQEGRNNLNRPVNPSEIEAAPENISSSSRRIHSEYFQTFKEVSAILHKLLPEI